MPELTSGEISFVDKIPLICSIDLTSEVVTDEISLDLSLKWVTWKTSPYPLPLPHPSPRWQSRKSGRDFEAAAPQAD